MSGPIRLTIRLKVPIVHGDDELHELELVEPTLEGLMAMDRATGELEKTQAMICACTALPPSVIKQLRGRDLKRIGEEVAQLMGEDQETGESSLLGLRINSTGPRAN